MTHVVRLIDSAGNEVDFDWHGLAMMRGMEIEKLRALLKEIHDDARTPIWLLQKIEALDDNG